MSYPVVVAYGRTPCCRARKGGLADVNPIDYAAACLKGVIAKVPYIEQHPEEIGDVVTGCAMAINEPSCPTLSPLRPSTVSAPPACRPSPLWPTPFLSASIRSALAAVWSA